MTLVLNGPKRAAPLLAPSPARGFRPLQITPAMRVAYDRTARPPTPTQAAPAAGDMPPMFRTPEHALAMAFGFAALRIEPRNATAVVIDSLRQRRAKLPSAMDGLTQHDWHAQAVFIRNLAERVLSPHPLLWQAVLAEYSHDVPGALALQAVGDALAEGLDGRDRLLADALIVRAFMGRPRVSIIADTFGVPRNTAGRHAVKWADEVRKLRCQAMARLHDPMQEAGLLVQP